MDRAKANKAFHGNLTLTKSWNGGREEAERGSGGDSARRNGRRGVVHRLAFRFQRKRNPRSGAAQQQ